MNSSESRPNHIVEDGNARSPMTPRLQALAPRIRLLLAILVASALFAGCTWTIDPEASMEKSTSDAVTFESGYVSVGDLEMYYEIHGAGEPLVLLHGGMTTIDTSFGALIPTLAQSRKVIAVEQQGHGHTVDVDRQLSFVQMADDTAALLQELGIEQADFFGYSDGGNVALGLAIHHPQLVRKVAIGGTNYNNEGIYPEILAYMQNPSPSLEGLEEMQSAYELVAPRPEDWPTFVRKVMALGAEFPGWASEDMQGIQAPTLIMVGDADIVMPEHAVEMYRLLPHANLAVLPATDHFLRLQSPEWLLSMLEDFLNAPMPQ